MARDTCMRGSVALQLWPEFTGRREWETEAARPHGLRFLLAAMPLSAKFAPLCAVGMTSRPPKWIKPQLTRLVDEAPTGKDWLHEIKYDGYRMHARIDGDQVKLLTRTGLYWLHRYRRTIEATAERSWRRSRVIRQSSWRKQAHSP